METFDEMYERHRKEYTKFMEDQYQSWQNLRKEYDSEIPRDVYDKWIEENGNKQLELIRANHAYERENYPESIIEKKSQELKEQQLEKSERDFEKNMDQSVNRATSKISRSYYDMKMLFRSQREAFFEEHFDSLYTLSDHGATAKDIKMFTENSIQFAKELAGNHYMELLNHPDNPQHKEQVDKMKTAPKELDQAAEEKKQKQEHDRQKLLKAFEEMKNTLTVNQDLKPGIKL